jgi:hypothetical protein
LPAYLLKFLLNPLFGPKGNCSVDQIYHALSIIITAYLYCNTL